jgi:hypothetical protein
VKHQGEKENKQKKKILDAVPKLHSHSQIVDYLKGKINSTKKFVQLHEAKDVIN